MTTRTKLQGSGLAAIIVGATIAIVVFINLTIRARSITGRESGSLHSSNSSVTGTSSALPHL